MNEPTTAGLDPQEVCTLPPEGLRQRRAWIAAEILPRARSSERGADWITLYLEDAPGLEKQLDELVALERECCGGIDFCHALEAGARRLEIRGIDPDASIFSALPGRKPATKRPATDCAGC